MCIKRFIAGKYFSNIYDCLNVGSAGNVKIYTGSGNTLFIKMTNQQFHGEYLVFPLPGFRHRHWQEFDSRGSCFHSVFFVQ